MTDYWYYTRNGMQQGPVALTELRRLIAEGKVLATELVWRAGMPDWVEVRSVAALRGVASTSAPVVAEVSESTRSAPVGQAVEIPSPAATPPRPVTQPSAKPQPSPAPSPAVPKPIPIRAVRSGGKPTAGVSWGVIALCLFLAVGVISGVITAIIFLSRDVPIPVAKDTMKDGNVTDKPRDKKAFVVDPKNLPEGCVKGAGSLRFKDIEPGRRQTLTWFVPKDQRAEVRATFPKTGRVRLTVLNFADERDIAKVEGAGPILRAAFDTTAHQVTRVSLENLGPDPVSVTVGYEHDDK